MWSVASSYRLLDRLGPVTKVRFYRPGLDGRFVRSSGQRCVVRQSLQGLIEFDGPAPPLVERHLSLTDAQQPIGWFTLDREGETTGCQQLATLETEARTMHGVLRIEPIFIDEFLSPSTPSTPVTACAQSEQSLAL